MNSERDSFGTLIARAGSAKKLLEFEREARRHERFARLDAITGEVITAALCGGKPLFVEISSDVLDAKSGALLQMACLSSEQRALLGESFSVENQQSRGTWSLPETVSAKIGVLHFSANFKQHGHFAHTVTYEDRHKVSLARSAEAVYYYALLEPLFEAIYEPFALRGELTGKRDATWRLERWQAVESFFEDLGFEVGDELAAMRYGAGWSHLSAAGRLEAKRRLLGALAAQARPEMASRHRAHRLLPLISRYYSKSDATRRALRKRVLTHELDRVHSAYFGGDWYSFLDYLGEEVHPKEHLTTALPETKLRLCPRLGERAEQLARPKPTVTKRAFPSSGDSRP